MLHELYSFSNGVLDEDNDDDIDDEYDDDLFATNTLCSMSYTHFQRVF